MCEMCGYVYVCVCNRICACMCMQSDICMYVYALLRDGERGSEGDKASGWPVPHAAQNLLMASLLHEASAQSRRGSARSLRLQHRSFAWADR